MIKSHLKIIVLKILNEKSLSGYDLVKEIHTSTQHWKPSFGSIYPLLKDLHTKKLVTINVIGRKKVYSITSAGKKKLKEILKTKNKIYDLTIEGLKGLEAICSKEEIEFIHKLHSNLKCNFMPFKEVTSEMQEIAKIMISMSDSEVLSRNENKIRKILKEAISKLKKIK